MNRTKNKRNRLIERGNVGATRSLRYDQDFQVAMDQLLQFGYVGYSEIIYDCVYSKYNALTKNEVFPTIHGMLEIKQQEKASYEESLAEIQRLKEKIGLIAGN